MKYIRGCVPVVLTACTITRPGENGFQDFVLMGTPVYENAVGRPSEVVTLEMITHMLPSVKVGLVAQDEAEGEVWRDMLADNGVSEDDLENLVVFPIEHTDLWFRDMGGIFVHLDPAGAAAESAAESAADSQGRASLDDAEMLEHEGETLAVVDFEFDGWGYGPISSDEFREFYAIDNLVAVELGEQMGIPVIYSPLILEGGAFTSNGEGTIIYSWPAVNHRNPGWTELMVELEIKRVLGAEKVIPMPVFHPADGSAVVDGPLVLDGRVLQYPYTVRHVDEYLSFVDEDTILVSQLPQEAVTNWIEQEIHDKMQEAWDFLAAQTDQDGNPFELVAFPDPGLITETMTGDDLIWQGLGTLQGLQQYDPNGGEIIVPASYMNYVITNDVVLVPTFAKEGRNPRVEDTDAEAVSVLESMYPDREVIQVDAENVTIGGGGMHCITQEVRSLSDFPDDED